MGESLINRLRSGGADELASNLQLFDNLETALLLRLDKNPDDENLLLQLASCRRKQGKLLEATELYQKLSNRHPLTYEYHFTVDALLGRFKGFLPRDVNPIHPSPLVQQMDYLEAGVVSDMLNHIFTNQAGFRPVGTMNKERKRSYDKKNRNNTGLSLKGNFLKEIFREKISKQLAEIKSRLGLADFKVAHIEVQLRAYHHGEYFRVHHDSMLNRRINFVYFFYPEPKPYEGGELIIYDSDPKKLEFSKDFTRIIPVNNKIVFFPSCYMHSVMTTLTKGNDFLSGRFVINGHIQERQ